MNIHVCIYIYYNIMHIYIYGTSSNHWRHLATIGFPNKKTMGFYRAIGHQPPPAASTSLPFRWGPDHSSARSGDPGALICRECQVWKHDFFIFFHSHPTSSLRFVGHQFLRQVGHEPQSLCSNHATCSFRLIDFMSQNFESPARLSTWRGTRY